MDKILHKILNEDFSNKIYVIGVDGGTGAGKTTFVKSLKLNLNQKGYKCNILHIDDFITPRNVRYNDSNEEWYCFYNLQWRYDYLLEQILKPIKLNSEFENTIEIYNKENDNYNKKSLSLKQGEILIIEGVFLQRPIIKEYFDFMIFIDVPQEIRLKRVLKRDIYIGNEYDIKSKYKRRYFPAEKIYFSECSPKENADFIICEF